MFSDKKEKNTQEPTTGQNRINEGTTIEGDINSTGYFRIDGHIKGNVKTPSKVVIGKTGAVIGTLTCDEADIEGIFEGNLHINKTLTLRSTAKINGDVIVGKLAVEPGANFNASCEMRNPNKEKKEKDLDSSRPYNRQNRSKTSSKKTTQI